MIRYASIAVTLAVALSGSAVVQGAERPTAAETLRIRWVNPPDNAPPGVSHHTFRSASMALEVGYNIYLPRVYEEQTDRRFPVVYFLHGSGGHESRNIDLAQHLHDAIEAGLVQPMLMVFVNGGNRTGYIDSVDQTVRPATMIITELIPHVDATYRTIADRAGRGIEGFSMGSGGALRLGLLHPELFGSIVAYGTGGMRELEQMPTAGDMPTPRDKRMFELRKIVHGEDLEHWRQTGSYYIAERQRDAVAGRLPIRMVIGTKDPSVESAFKAQDRLAELMIPHEFELVHDVPHDIRDLYRLVGLKGLRQHDAVFGSNSPRDGG